jgi:hypothetical protein
MDESTQQSLKKRTGLLLVFRKNYKPAGYSTMVVLLLPDAPDIRKECQIRGVSFEVLSDSEEARI